MLTIVNRIEEPEAAQAAETNFLLKSRVMKKNE
jgi:hypothetical protein